MKKVIIISVVALLSLVAMAQDKKVAVFDPAGSAENTIKEILREEISSIIVNAGGFTVLERQLINKVLEENKFQSGGLVDDSQISEIGKRMGANLVFVTNLSRVGKNYYVSCKLIDVQTARIEKQKTAQTTRGSNDLVSTVRKMVGEMFAKTTGSIDQEPIPNNIPAFQNAPNSNITFSEFKAQLKLERKEMRYEKKSYPDMLAGNSFALASYKKYRAKQTAGWTLFGTGLVLAIPVGTCFFFFAESFYYDDYYGYYRSNWWGLEAGIALWSVGAVAFFTGVGLLGASNKNLKTAYHFYTKGGRTACTLNVVPLVSPKFQGVGLALRF